MKSMYRAVEITSPGVFSLVEKRFPSQAPDRCESGSRLVVFAIRMQQLWKHSFPTFPIARSGSRGYRTNRRSGSWRHDLEDRPACRSWIFRGEDGTCEACRRGETVYCQNPIITGVTTDGGYAEMMIAEARALSLIPDELKSGDAAPLVCAGITTFNALRNAGRAGDTVAVQD